MDHESLNHDFLMISKFETQIEILNDIFDLIFSFERVCPQLNTLQTELKTLRAEMRICEAKIDHYSGQLKRVQNEVYELHR